MTNVIKNVVIFNKHSKYLNAIKNKYASIYTGGLLPKIEDMKRGDMIIYPITPFFTAVVMDVRKEDYELSTDSGIDKELLVKYLNEVKNYSSSLSMPVKFEISNDFYSQNNKFKNICMKILN